MLLSGDRFNIGNRSNEHSVILKMLTRREKLLNRPWQLRRYNNHRHKVLTALPAIDFGPPTERRHVTCKLKKQQWEGERRHKIEEDNFKLLQRMGSIMKKNRLENHWQTPPPDFLHRVGIYHRTRSPTPYKELLPSSSSDEAPAKHRGCSACTPCSENEPVIPEERIPWPPPRQRVSRRRSSSIAVKPFSDFDIPKKSHDKYESSPLGLPLLPVTSADRVRSKSVISKKFQEESLSEKRLVLTQGSLKLCVNFPPQAEIKIVSGNENKYIQRSRCECKALETMKI